MSLQALFGLTHPVLQAPMAGASTPELVAAVSGAGGLGGLGAASMGRDFLRQQIQAIRGLTNKPFNVNLFSPASQIPDPSPQPEDAVLALIERYHREFGIDEKPVLESPYGDPAVQLEVLIEERVPVISFHFGVESGHVEAIHSAGLKVICSATTIEEAKWLDTLGVDAIIAQGAEAGGHRGTFIGDYRDALIGTMALVPQVVDVVKVPVIAAGGIMDARGIVAAYALGAAGVQMGTAFLGCPEAGIADLWRNQLLASSPSRPRVTTAMSGKPARGLRNRYIEDMEALGDALLPYPLQYALSAPVRRKALAVGNADFHAMWSGQGVGLLEQMPAAALMATLIEESESLKSQLM
jgi:nitronate monooxygenase